MKITAVDVTPVRVPSPFRYGDIESVAGVVVKLQTDQGVDGLGHAITLSDRHFRSLVAATEEIGELIVGDRDRIPAYASLRLGRGVDTPDLPEIASSLVEQGFTAVKTNLGGRPTVAEDIARMKVIREAIGPHVRLLADVNFRWTPSMAIRMGRTLDDVRLFWLEDPVPTHNVQGLCEVRRSQAAQIAAGEALYSLPALRELFEARALDVPMPDLLRVGGITPFVKIAHMAEAFGLPLANHLLPEISAQVVAAVPNGLIVEYVPWAWQLLHGCPTLENGELVMSERPGHGMELDEDFVQHHRVE